MRKDTRLSPVFCTASDEKLGGAWERGYRIPIMSTLKFICFDWLPSLLCLVLGMNPEFIACKVCTQLASGGKLWSVVHLVTCCRYCIPIYNLNTNNDKSYIKYSTCHTRVGYYQMIISVCPIFIQQMVVNPFRDLKIVSFWAI